MEESSRLHCFWVQSIMTRIVLSPYEHLSRKTQRQNNDKIHESSSEIYMQLEPHGSMLRETHFVCCNARLTFRKPEDPCTIADVNLNPA